MIQLNPNLLAKLKINPICQVEFWSMSLFSKHIPKGSMQFGWGIVVKNIIKCKRFCNLSISDLFSQIQEVEVGLYLYRNSTIIWKPWKSR